MFTKHDHRPNTALEPTPGTPCVLSGRFVMFGCHVSAVVQLFSLGIIHVMFAFEICINDQKRFTAGGDYLSLNAVLTLIRGTPLFLWIL
jgi:hypothetical protein